MMTLLFYSFFPAYVLLVNLSFRVFVFRLIIYYKNFHERIFLVFILYFVHTIAPFYELEMSMENDRLRVRKMER